MVSQSVFPQYSYRYFFVIVSFLTTVSACTLLTGPKREVSTVSHIEVPLSVQAHAVKAREPFAIMVYTVGGGKTIPDKVEVRITGLSAEITPYDIIEQSSIVRSMVASIVPRPVTLQFDTPGIATIRVIGRGSQQKPTIQQTEVVVLPP